MMLKPGFVTNATTVINMSGSWTNSITRSFTVKKQTGSCGVEMPWKIYEATRIVDGMDCSVFVFEKKIGEKLHKPRRKEIISEFLRKEVQNCQTLNHSKILKILHPIEENSETLAFAAEKVHFSLANALGDDTRLSPSVAAEIKKMKMSDLEIKHGIYQLTDCLRYLHTSQQLIHNNINPSVILISRTGHWKIFGTGFLTGNSNISKEQITELQWSAKVPKMVQPDLDYIAPEVQLGGAITSSVDMFALGLIICATYMGQGSRPLISANKTLANYLKCIEDLHKQFSQITSVLPAALVEPVEKMLSKDIRYRPNSQLFSLLKYFDDMLLLSMDGIVNFEEKSVEEKIQFLQGLPDILSEYPKELLTSRVYNFLCNHITVSRSFYEPCFQSLMSCVEASSFDQYNEFFKDGIMEIIRRAKSNSIQECTSILQFSEPLFYKMAPADIQQELVSILTQSIESDIIEAQTTAFDSLRYFRDYLSETLLKTEIVPKLITTFRRRKVIKIRASVLHATSVIIPILAKTTIIEDIIPFLTEINTGDVDLIMSVINIYKEIMNRRVKISKELIIQITDSLLSYVLNPGLKRHHTRALIDILHLVIEKIDLESTDSFESNCEQLLDTEISSIEACENLETVDSEPEMESEIEQLQSALSGKKFSYSDSSEKNGGTMRPSFSIGSPTTLKTSSSALKMGKNLSAGSLKYSDKSHKGKLLQMSSFKLEESDPKPLSFNDRRRQTIDASMGGNRHISHSVAGPLVLGTHTIRLTGGKNIKTTPRNIVLSAIAQAQVSDEERSILKQQMTPPPMGRRHSFAFSPLPVGDSGADLITAAVCEGPFQHQSSKSSDSRRWQGPYRGNSITGDTITATNSRLSRQNSNPTEKPPVTRQSSFTVLSDAVMNFFCSNNPQK